MLLGPARQIPSLSAILIATPPGPAVSYIVCLHGRVPDIYKVWRLNRDGVRKFQSTARVKLFTLFAENTFRSAFKDIRGFRVPFVGRQSVNGSVEFLHYSDVTSNSSCHIISTQNIFEGAAESVFGKISEQFDSSGRVNFANSIPVESPDLVPFRDPPVQTHNITDGGTGA